MRGLSRELVVFAFNECEKAASLNYVCTYSLVNSALKPLNPHNIYKNGSCMWLGWSDSYWSRHKRFSVHFACTADWQINRCIEILKKYFKVKLRSNFVVISKKRR